MLMFNKQKHPATPADAAAEFTVSLDAAIAVAELAHVRMHQLADLIESRARDIRVRFAAMAPLR